jgi:putative peptidoglycan lipid II flippase
MLKKIWKQPINNVAVAAALVAFFSLLSRLLGVVRDRILAGRFGAGAELDMYYAAFRVPDLVFNLLVLGALSAGFIPIFTSLIKEKSSDSESSENHEAWDLANNVLNHLLIATSLLALLGSLFSRELVQVMTPGFSQAQRELTATMTRIMFLSPILLGASSIFGGILQSFKRFLAYSLAPVMYNLGIIFGAVFLVGRFGLIGLSWGVVLGALCHLGIQYLAAKKLGYNYSLFFKRRDPQARKIGRMMVPRTLSLAISQINLVATTVIASGLSAGSLAIFNFANNLQSFPVGVFGISFAIAAFPTLSSLAFDKDRLVNSFTQAFKQILFFVIPATVMMIALRAQIIRVVLGTGEFNWRDTIETMGALGYFSLSLFAQATIPLLVRVFYARHNSSTPFWIGLVSVFVNIVLAFYLAPLMGVAGLALAFSVGNIVNFVLLWSWIYIALDYFDLSRLLLSVAKMTFSAIMAGAAIQLSKMIIGSLVNMESFFGILAQLSFSALAGLLVYLFFCYLLKSEELLFFVASLARRWPFNKNKMDIDDQGEARGV